MGGDGMVDGAIYPARGLDGRDCGKGYKNWGD